MKRASSLAYLLVLIVIGLWTVYPTSVQAAARDLSFTQQCVGGKANVTFSWAGTAPDGLQIWIDLTVFDNRWQPGTFIGAGPIEGSATTYTWNGLTADTAHYMRVNQQLANGTWDPSNTYRFMTRCGPTSSGPSTTPATNSYRILGFSAQGPVANLPPPGLTPDAGTLANCTATTIYAYVIVNSAEGKQVSVVWYYNGGVFSEAHALSALKAGPNAYVLSIFNQASVPSRDSSGSNTLSFKMTSGGDKVEAEGSVKISCS
jgi:hypothetical protein